MASGDQKRIDVLEYRCYRRLLRFLSVDINRTSVLDKIGSGPMLRRRMAYGAE